MGDIMKELDKLNRFRPKEDTMVLRSRGAYVSFEQVKTVIGQWIVDNATPTDSAKVREAVTTDYWIPVSEKLPEVGVYVLVCKAGCNAVDTDYWSERHWGRSRDVPCWYWGRISGVTHWKPLPAPALADLGEGKE